MKKLAVAMGLCLAACGGGGGRGAGAKVDPDKSSVTLSHSTTVPSMTDRVDVKVLVRDSANQPLQDIDVGISLSGSNNYGQTTAKTGADGAADLDLGSTEVGTKTVTARADGVVLTQQPTLLIEPGPAVGFVWVVQPTNVKVGAAIAPPPRLELRDVGNNPTNVGSPMVNLRLVWNSSNGVLGGTDVATPVDGGVEFPMLTVSRPQAGYALRAENQIGADESAKFDVALGDPAMATSSMTLVPGAAQANGVASTTVTVTLRDVASNPVSGQLVTLSSTGTGNTFGSASGMSDAMGVFTTTMSSTVPEVKTVTATAGPLTLSGMVTFTP